MPQTVEVLLSRNLQEVFGERDSIKRHRAIAELYSPDCTFADHNDEHHGHAELEDAVEQLQARFPDFVFAETGQPQVSGPAGRLAWSFGPSADTPRVRGTDVVLVREGKIAALFVFLDAAPAGPT